MILKILGEALVVRYEQWVIFLRGHGGSTPVTDLKFSLGFVCTKYCIWYLLYYVLNMWYRPDLFEVSTSVLRGIFRPICLHENSTILAPFLTY